MHDSGALRLRVDAGPDAGRTMRLHDRTTVGRAPGVGCVDDPLVEPHHLAIDPRRRLVAQLTGRVPARIDGVALRGPARIGRGSIIEVGASRIVVGPHVAPRAAPGTIRLGVALVPGGDAAGSAPVCLDLLGVRRLLVRGPSALAFATALAGRIELRTRVTTAPVRRGAQSEPDAVVIGCDPDPDAGWPAADLPRDAVAISVGTTWRATLVGWTPTGELRVERFHAAGGGRVDAQRRAGRASPRR